MTTVARLRRARAQPRSIPTMALLVVAGIALAELPLLLSACCGPSDRAGLGSFWFINDFAQYEAAMREAALGSSWLAHNHFTPEPHPAALMFTLYVALGKLSALSGLSGEALLRFTELLARLGFLGALAWFLRVFLAEADSWALGFVLAAFGMGLGLPVALAANLAGRESAYTGNGSYEVNTVGLLFGAPHATLGMALSLAMVAALWAYLLSPAAWKLAAVVLAGPAIAMLHAFHLPGLLLALLAAPITALRRGPAAARAGRRALLALVGSAALAAPFLMVTVATFSAEPFWSSTYGRQNQLPSPTPWQLPIDYGVVLLLALLGAAVALRRGGPLRWLTAFVALLVILMYLPVPYQRRLSFGLQPALAALAAVGTVELERELKSRGWAGQRMLRPAVVGLALCTTALAVAAVLISALADSPLRPYRASADEAAAADWLAENSSADAVVMASWDAGNFLAGRVPGRVVGGHPVATLEALSRASEIERFFSSDGEPMRALARKYSVTHVWYGERERKLGGEHLAGAQWLRPAYRLDTVTVYTVVEP